MDINGQSLPKNLFYTEDLKYFQDYLFILDQQVKILKKYLNIYNSSNIPNVQQLVIRNIRLIKGTNIPKGNHSIHSCKDYSLPWPPASECISKFPSVNKATYYDYQLDKNCQCLNNLQSQLLNTILIECKLPDNILDLSRSGYIFIDGTSSLTYAFFIGSAASCVSSTLDLINSVVIEILIYFSFGYIPPLQESTTPINIPTFDIATNTITDTTNGETNIVAVPSTPTNNLSTFTNILLIGGGAFNWTTELYETFTQTYLPKIKTAGWDGICIDWEQAGPSSTDDTTTTTTTTTTTPMADFIAMITAINTAGLKVYITTDAEGPFYVAPNYAWTAEEVAPIWDHVEYVIPQLYGASGENYPSPAIDNYIAYWQNGGPTLNYPNLTLPAVPASKVLFAVSPFEPATEVNIAGYGSGYVTWCQGIPSNS